MRIIGNGVVLQRLGADELERVRQWRNSPHVREQMEFQEEISPADQSAWFSRIDNPQNWYFLFGERADEWVGVCHVKDIHEGLGEAGVFTGQFGYLGTPLPVKAVLHMMDFAFGKLGLQRLRAKMRADRPAILAFNRKLGYRPLSGPEDSGFVRMEVTAEDYFRQADALRKMAGVQELRVEADPEDPEGLGPVGLK